MSFCQETKNDLCTLAVKSKCCRKALLYGMLLSGNVFAPEKIRLVTENEKTAYTILHLLEEIYGVKGNLYVSEKKAGEGKINSYKLTVSAREDLRRLFADYAPEGDWEGAVCPDLFHCGECFRLFLRGAFLSDILSGISESCQEVFCFLLLGIAENFSGTALFADDTLVHVYHAGAYISCKGHLMGNHQHGHALLGETLHDLQHLAHHF
ncbi:MAG: hypothetical protein IJY89_02830, partial [Clostridia bacterium]|nr:hypothetical protein [Clostridia bacterium]